jgi:hypothetical protein
VIFEQFKCAIHRDARDIAIDLLRPFEYFSGIQVLRSTLHHLKNYAALARQADAARA